jgi:recombination protein RecR
MPYHYPDALSLLIQHLSSLPGIGPKTAQRLAFHLLNRAESEVMALARSIANAYKLVHPCPCCGNLTDEDLCSICRDTRRDANLLCVVEQPRDVLSMERSHSYKGFYHVLRGAISPLDGIGPNDLNIPSLIERAEKGAFAEIIMATNPNVEGETTALYLAKLLKTFGIKVSRIAHGLPVGGDLEYADEATLAQAINGRREI